MTGIATSLRFYWQERGAAEIVLPQDTGTVLLSLDHAATLRVEALDAQGNVVPLSGQLWDGSGTWFSVDTTSNPNMVTVTSISESPYDPVVLTADADPGPGAHEIIGIVAVRVVKR